jgi:purine nucleosidase
MSTKVLLDTDIGSDIDDAVCLAYLLANPRADLVGITTVSGEPVQRARLASALCYAAGRPDIPVVPGASEPLSGPQRQPRAEQAAVLPRWAHRSVFPVTPASDFLAETVRRHPGEVTLLSIGPMTNVAQLFSGHPDVPALLGSLMIMAGRFGDMQIGMNADEWNIHCDPEAARTVYSTPVVSHSSVGIDVTTQVRMPAAEVRRRFAHPLLAPVLDMAEVHFKSSGDIVFHDPLAAVSVFYPDTCTWRAGRVRIDTVAGAGQGLTRFEGAPVGDGGAPHRVASTVRTNLFFERFFGVFGG